MESRKRRTARSRSFSREREEYSDLDIPIRRGEEQRRTGEQVYSRADTYEEEAYHHPRRQRGSESKRGKRKKSNLLKGALFLVLFLCGIFVLFLHISEANIVLLPSSVWTVVTEQKRRVPFPM